MKRTLVIRGSEWLRANSQNFTDAGEDTSLCDASTKTKCCLGIHLHQMGFSEEELEGEGYPYEVDELEKRLPQYPKSLISNPFPLTSINDDNTTSDEEKIAALRPLFKEIGWNIDWRKDE